MKWVGELSLNFHSILANWFFLELIFFIFHLIFTFPDPLRTLLNHGRVSTFSAPNYPMFWFGSKFAQELQYFYCFQICIYHSFGMYSHLATSLITILVSFFSPEYHFLRVSCLSLIKKNIKKQLLVIVIKDLKTVKKKKKWIIQ